MSFNKHYLYRFLAGDVTQQEFESLVRPFPFRLDWLRRNHEEGVPVYCCCAEPAPEMFVCIRGKTIFLRRASQGHRAHGRLCQHSIPPADRNEPGREYVPGVRALDDGSFRIAESQDIFPARAEELRESVTHAASAAAPRPGATRPTRGKSTLLGLFRFLLAEVGVHYWDPTLRGRTASRLSEELARVIDQCSLSRGRSLAECAIPFHRATDLKLQINKSVGGTRSTPELILFTPLIAATPTRSMVRLSVGGRTPNLYAFRHAWVACEESFGRFLVSNDDGSFKYPLWAALTLRVPSGPNPPPIICVSSVAVVAMTPAMIPIESAYEFEFAELLVRSKRSFSKPLGYDREDGVFPDFILHDTKPETHAEVLGFTDAKYRARIEEKRRLAAAERRQFISWDAVSGAPLPRLPPASQALKRV